MKHAVLVQVLLVTAVCMTLSCAKVMADAGALNVLDFGAKADGISDNTAAFQQALDEAGKTGAAVNTPAGTYRFAGHLAVPTGVTLVGSWQGPPTMSAGTMLLATEGAGHEDAPAFITLNVDAGVKGVIISYPNQKPDTDNPAPYPWAIRGLAQDAQVQDVLLLRAYNGVDFGTYPCGRHYINNLYGSPLRRGIYIDGAVDVGRINNVHFTGFGSGPKLNDWRRKHGEAICIGRADWEWITNCFIIGYKAGIRLFWGRGGNGKLEGPPHYVQIAHSGTDLMETPMIVEDCSVLNASECIFKGKAIQIRSSNTHPVRFSQCSFSPGPGTASLVEAGGKGRVSFVDCTFEFWDVDGKGAPALKADCASLLVQGCEFGTDNRASFMQKGRVKQQIDLTTNLKSGVITGNRFRYGTNITNRSHGQVVISGNVTDDVDAGVR